MSVTKRLLFPCFLGLAVIVGIVEQASPQAAFPVYNPGITSKTPFSGGGSTSLSLNSRFSNLLTPFNYGAVGNGTTNDATALFSFAAQKGFLSPGVSYGIGSASGVTVSDGHSVVGIGSRPIATAVSGLGNGSSLFIHSTAGTARFNNIELDIPDPGNGNQQRGIHLKGSTRDEVANISGFTTINGAYNVLLDGNIVDARIHDFNFLSSSDGIITSNEAGAPSNTFHSEGTFISGGTISGNGANMGTVGISNDGPSFSTTVSNAYIHDILNMTTGNSEGIGVGFANESNDITRSNSQLITGINARNIRTDAFHFEDAHDGITTSGVSVYNASYGWRSLPNATSGDGRGFGLFGFHFGHIGRDPVYSAAATNGDATTDVAIVGGTLTDWGTSTNWGTVASLIALSTAKQFDYANVGSTYYQLAGTDPTILANWATLTSAPEPLASVAISIGMNPAARWTISGLAGSTTNGDLFGGAVQNGPITIDGNVLKTTNGAAFDFTGSSVSGNGRNILVGSHNMLSYHDLFDTVDTNYAANIVGDENVRCSSTLQVGTAPGNCFLFRAERGGAIWKMEIVWNASNDITTPADVIQLWKRSSAGVSTQIGECSIASGSQVQFDSTECFPFTGSYAKNNRQIDPGDVVYAVETATGSGTATFWVTLNYSEFGIGG